MFEIDLSPTYFWPVKFSLPKAEGGAQVVSFQAQFKRLDADAIDELMDKVKAEKLSDAWLAAQLVAGWREITDRNGADVPFSEGQLGRLLKIPGLGTVVVQTYFASLPKAAEKN